MFVPQEILIAALAMTGMLTKRSSLLLPRIHPAFPNNISTASKVASGKILDFAVEKCLDADGNVRCSKPFLVTKSTCYNLAWTTEGSVSHTTVEVRDAGSDELVYYRDTDGQWTPEKGEVSFGHVGNVNFSANALWCSSYTLTSSRGYG